MTFLLFLDGRPTLPASCLISCFIAGTIFSSSCAAADMPELTTRAAATPATSIPSGETPAENTHVLTTEPLTRYTPDAVRGDWIAIEALQSKYKTKRDSMDSYAAWKAWFLMDFAITEYEENDRTGIVAWALDSAQAIINAPNQKRQREIAFLSLSANAHTGITSTEHVTGLEINAIPARELTYLRKARERNGALPCAAETLAHLDVGLIALAHQQWEVSHLGKSSYGEEEQIKVISGQKHAIEQAMLHECRVTPESASSRKESNKTSNSK